MGRTADSVFALIDAAMAAGRPDGFDPALALIDRSLATAPDDGVMLHYRGYTLFRKASIMSRSGASDDDVKAVLEAADDALEASAAVLDWPETPALRASVLGQMIVVGGMLQAMRLGPKVNSLMGEATKSGASNPRVWMLRGISAMHKPRLFGGGMGRAERDLKRAIELFGSDSPVAPAPAWGHAEAWAWLGQVYAAEDRIDDARASYAKALELDPGFGWVKHQLLPALGQLDR